MLCWSHLNVVLQHMTTRCEGITHQFHITSTSSNFCIRTANAMRKYFTGLNVTHPLDNNSPLISVIEPVSFSVLFMMTEDCETLFLHTWRHSICRQKDVENLAHSCSHQAYLFFFLWGKLCTSVRSNYIQNSGPMYISAYLLMIWEPQQRELGFIPGKST